MTARVLVVDDLAPNVKLLEAKLRAEYFEVITALGGREAIELARTQSPDIILLDVMMPGIDGFETCKLLKEDPLTRHIPVVMVTALDQRSDRIAGLEAGADDFLTKPVQDLALFARVRNLSRLKQMTDELRHRHAQGAQLGAIETPKIEDVEREIGEVIIISDRPVIEGLENDSESLLSGINFSYQNDSRELLDRIRTDLPDMIMVDLGLESYDPLRLCSAIRSAEGSRLLPLLAIADQEDTRRLVKALDIGVNDYLMRPIDVQEMAARVRTQLRRKWYVEHLRDSLSQSLELAVLDGLTGIYNRRFLQSQLPRLLTKAVKRELPLSVMILDVDFFKAVNDTYGHDVGDAVLREIGHMLHFSLRGMDLACRYGGEEFVVVLPETPREGSEVIAERLRKEIAGLQIDAGNGQSFSVTVSIGMAFFDGTSREETPASLLKRADEALYRAKEGGRNRVILEAA
ncbi:putative diguanylate cyclase (GGDEF) [Parvularcula bermudensis HTCC2503]|uniref:diguanylate cyclase n=1 Tax=Parvularcula bermudensis (strain ATCC BAA-594 / HTCC2503 / KCTC 12087) TaxID=314260 RepID=E0TCC3_PARBH|nr:PleD family two-component system response regulator [Parvularcula bermudensis]ADM08556.1 putative diguanylate cyclase (GGDEF) [Parvularcula bermudensis HTCC2503]